MEINIGTALSTPVGYLQFFYSLEKVFIAGYENQVFGGLPSLPAS
jgi:hypothetical protein